MSPPVGFSLLTTFKRRVKGAVLVVLVDFAFEDRGFYYRLSGFLAFGEAGIGWAN